MSETQRDGVDDDRPSRRRVLAAAGAASVPLVAGCISLGGGGDEEMDDEEDDQQDEDMEETTEPGTPTETPTDTPTRTPTPADIQASGESTVDGLKLVSTAPRLDYYSEDKYFAADVTVENTGSETTHPMDYNHVITAYDADGNDITKSGYGASSDGADDIGPGEQDTIVANTEVEGSKHDVARYEVVVQCEGFVRADGVYCE